MSDAIDVVVGRAALARAEAAQNGVVTQYAAWAIALGEIDRWTKVVSGSSAFRETSHDRRGRSDMYMIPMLSNLERSSVATGP